MAQSAPFQFTISLPEQPQLTVMLSRWEASIRDWRPFWNNYFAPAWYRHVDTTYITQGSSAGQPWPQLSPAYAEWKNAKWPGMPLGVLSGATRESLTFPNDSNGIWRAGPTSLTVGTKVPYARYLQSGTRRMPPRPPLTASREFVLEVGRLLNTYAHDTMKKAREK